MLRTGSQILDVNAGFQILKICDSDLLARASELGCAAPQDLLDEDVKGHRGNCEVMASQTLRMLDESPSITPNPGLPLIKEAGLA